MFDRLLVDPDEKALVIALEQAAHSAGMKPVGPDSRYWWPLLDEIANNSEGRSQLAHMFPEDGDKRYVAIAWWSDHQKGRHIRVCGGDARDGRHRHYSRMDEDTRPPLWHVYPEHVYRVLRAGGEAVWLASCACGVTGLPEMLAWMGPCCGPCHDRRLDGEMIAGTDWPTILDQHGERVHALAFSPDGNALAVTSRGRTLHLYDLRDGNMVWLYSDDTSCTEDEELHPMVFSPDGRFLATGEFDAWVVRICNLGRFPTDCDTLFGTHSPVEQLIFSPDSKQLAACTTDRELVIWRNVAGEWYEQAYSPPEGVSSIDFSPDGQTLALGNSSGNVILQDFSSWTETGRVITGANWNEEVLFLHYTSDGASLVLLTGNTDVGHWRSSLQLRLWNLADNYEEQYADIPIISALALSPDGHYLAWIVHDDQHSPAEVTFWDLTTWREARRLEWNTEDDLRELAFSPDGETLAIGSESGVVKLVPWRALLQP